MLKNRSFIDVETYLIFDICITAIILTTTVAMHVCACVWGSQEAQGRWARHVCQQKQQQQQQEQQKKATTKQQLLVIWKTGSQLIFGNKWLSSSRKAKIPPPHHSSKRTLKCSPFFPQHIKAALKCFSPGNWLLNL